MNGADRARRFHGDAITVAQAIVARNDVESRKHDEDLAETVAQSVGDAFKHDDARLTEAESVLEALVFSRDLDFRALP